jgi:hypothetical protein
MEARMSIARPKKCRLDQERNGVAFSVEIDGRQWKCFITREAVGKLYADQDIVRAVSNSSQVTRKIAERIKAGDVEPITFTSTMFDEKGR